jgi:hypothetical protein
VKSSHEALNRLGLPTVALAVMPEPCSLFLDLRSFLGVLFSLFAISPSRPGHITCREIEGTANAKRKNPIDFLAAFARRPIKQKRSRSHRAFVIDIEPECILESHFLDSCPATQHSWVTSSMSRVARISTTVILGSPERFELVS